MPRHPDRALPLAGASNFRDLGGYLGSDGRSVRWRKLFRSDHLGALTPDDARTLGELGVGRAFDFRGATERAAVPYDVQGVAQYSLPIEPTVVQRMKDLVEAGQTVSPEQTVALMQQTYRAFVHDNAARFATLFEHLLESDAPLVFHCTAGKDRTGWAAALLLTALGVDEEQIMEDYLLTNQYFRRPAQMYGQLSEEALDALWRVQPSYLMASVDVVRAQHGSVDRYLTQVLGIDGAARERLAELYLET